MTDNFQPMAIVKKLDEMRESLKHAHNSPPDKTEKEWFDMIEGMKIALVWARVEIMEMAFSKDRYTE